MVNKSSLNDIAENELPDDIFRKIDTLYNDLSIYAWAFMFTTMDANYVFSKCDYIMLYSNNIG